MNGIDIVIHFLKAATAVTNITTRAGIYPIEAPQNLTPSKYLILNFAGGNDGKLLSGAAGYPQQRVRVECIAPSGSGALELGDAVLNTLKSIVKQAISGARDIDIEWADFDLTDPADALAQARRTLDFYVRWRAA